MTMAAETTQPAPAINPLAWPAAPATQGLTVTDYARKIHWWVRLFGVVWLASIGLAVAFGVIVGLAAAVQMSDTTSYSPSYSPSSPVSGMTYSQCLADLSTTYDECQSLR